LKRTERKRLYDGWYHAFEADAEEGGRAALLLAESGNVKNFNFIINEPYSCCKTPSVH